MKNLRLITLLTLVLATVSTSVNAEVQVKLGQLKTSETTLETGQLSLNATYENIIVSVAYDTEERIMLTVGMSL